jgi:hypothetical protein
MHRFEARGLRVNSALPSSLLLLLFFLPHFNVILLSGIYVSQLKETSLVSLLEERTSSSYITLMCMRTNSLVLAHLQIPKLICLATFEIKFDCFANPGLTLEVVNNKN